MTEQPVGQLLHSHTTGVVYRVESVDPDAFPSEQELTLRPVYARKEHMGSNRSKLSRENWMAGTGHQSIAWAGQVSKVTERDVERMRDRDE